MLRLQNLCNQGMRRKGFRPTTNHDRSLLWQQLRPSPPTLSKCTFAALPLHLIALASFRYNPP